MKSSDVHDQILQEQLAEQNDRIFELRSRLRILAIQRNFALVGCVALSVVLIKIILG